MRLIALLVLLIPGFIAGLGIKLMRDIFFNVLHPPFPALWFQFIFGLIIFIGGLAFIGGFIFHRDRKRGKVAPQFRKKTQ